MRPGAVATPHQHRAKLARVAKKRRFARAFVKLGHNAAKAAIEVGYKPSFANNAAGRLTSDETVARMIEQETERALRIAGLEVDRVLIEVARIALADPLRLLDDEGKRLPMHLWPVPVAAAVQSVEFAEDGSVKKVRFWSKTEALGLAMRHHGLLLGREDPPPPPDPEFESKRKRLMGAVYELLAQRAAGKNLDKPLLVEGKAKDITPAAAPPVSNGKANGGGNHK